MEKNEMMIEGVYSRLSEEAAKILLELNGGRASIAFRMVKDSTIVSTVEVYNLSDQEFLNFASFEGYISDLS